MMTKQEERQTLAQIEKLIGSAGPDSYIGMAFAGCCDIARDNIENDFGNSFKESLEACRRNAEAEHDMRLRLEYEVDNLNRAVARRADELEDLRKQLKAQRDKQLPAELYRSVWLAVNDHEEAADRRIEECVDILAQFADAPKDIAVSDALKNLKEAYQRRDKYRRMIEELDKYNPE